MRIGFPATLIYYTFYPFWKTFFHELGAEVITSPITTKKILDNGVKETVTDACVPIKLFHGHVMALGESVDFMFIPRMVSVDKWATFCPKFLGLPDMIRYSLSNLPKIIDQRIDLKKGKLELWKACRSIGSTLGRDSIQVVRAYSKALLQHKKYLNLLVARYTPFEAMKMLEGCGDTAKLLAGSDKSDLDVAVLGYPYQVYDPYISVNLLQHLAAMGVNIHTMEMVPIHVQRSFRRILPKDLFWYYSNSVIWSTYYYLQKKPVDGIIHVTAFGCGPDAMVDKLMELESKRLGNIPFMSITIDEHTGEAGLLTRLEAFVDMLRLRRDKN